MQSDQIKGHVAAASANVMWGLMAPVAKLVMAAGIVSPMLMGGCRIFGAALLFWIASMFIPKERVGGKDYFLLASAAMLASYSIRAVICLASVSRRRARHPSSPPRCHYG